MTEPEEFVRLNCPVPEGRSSSIRIFLALVSLLAMAAIVLGSRSGLREVAGIHNIPQAHEAVVTPHVSPAPSSTSLASTFAKSPLAFEPNQGQADPRVRFLDRGAGYGLFLTSDKAVLRLHRAVLNGKPSESVVSMKLAGANPNAEVASADELPAKSNYFIGDDPSRWRTSVPQFARVRYREIYPGIDLVYYGNQGQLEYDFRVAPGADPKNIQLSFDGASGLRLDSGDLLVRMGAGDFWLKAPRVYEEGSGSSRKPVNG